MTARSWIRPLLARTPRTAGKARARCRPALEALEERTLLDTGMTGGGLPLDNMQPSEALNYIIAVKGVYPQRDGSTTGTGQEALLGEVRLAATDVGQLRAENEKLKKECLRHQALVRLARQAAALREPSRPGPGGKKRRARKQSRGQQTATRLQQAEAALTEPGAETPGG